MPGCALAEPVLAICWPIVTSSTADGAGPDPQVRAGAGTAYRLPNPTRRVSLSAIST